jgi:hypothetical protein
VCIIQLPPSTDLIQFGDYKITRYIISINIIKESGYLIYVNKWMNRDKIKEKKKQFEKKLYKKERKESCVNHAQKSFIQ